MAGLYARSIGTTVMTIGCHIAISKIMFYSSMLRVDFTTVNLERLQFGRGSEVWNYCVLNLLIIQEPDWMKSHRFLQVRNVYDHNFRILSI
jgi:hypothetical protein